MTVRLQTRGAEWPGRLIRHGSTEPAHVARLAALAESRRDRTVQSDSGTTYRDQGRQHHRQVLIVSDRRRCISAVAGVQSGQCVRVEYRPAIFALGMAWAVLTPVAFWSFKRLNNIAAARPLSTWEQGQLVRSRLGRFACPLCAAILILTALFG